MKRLALVIVALAAFVASCATVPTGRVESLWRQVNEDYDCGGVEMPSVVWVQDDMYLRVRGVDARFVNGAYNWTTNTVYLREWWADEGTVVHEFRHACGDLMGEKKGSLVFETD